MNNDLTPLEKLADKMAHSSYAIQAVRFSQLNPEQQMAHVLAQLVEQKKETLALMNTLNLLAQECVKWRATPEGQAWAEKMRKQREEKSK